MGMLLPPIGCRHAYATGLLLASLLPPAPLSVDGAAAMPPADGEIIDAFALLMRFDAKIRRQGIISSD